MGLIALAVVDGRATERGADTPALDSTYAQDAIETARDKIEKVGGALCDGPVRGGHVYKGNVYAFRDNVAGDECLMFVKSALGWIQIDLGSTLDFTSGGGAYSPVDGDDIVGASSGATATIARVVTQSGDIGAGGTAAGYFVLTNQVGTFQVENLNIGINNDVATIAADSVDTTLEPGGHYEFENYNFFGTTGTFRMYGVSGANPAFEFDGTTYVPILTGNTNDTPAHLAVNEYHLFLAFEKGSLQHSDTGDPYNYVSGGEIGTGDELVGLKKEVGGALGVFCRNRSFMLHGKGTSDSPWDLKTLSDEAGAIEWTIQRIGVTRYLDDRGFTRAEAVQAFGDFKDSVYSQLIEPLILEKKESVVSSIIVKSKSQLRTFFNDGTGIIATFDDKKLSGFTTLNYNDDAGLPVTAECTANGEDAGGVEILFFGSSNGYLYQMDKGTSFDGGAVDATFVLTYNNLGSPSLDKQFKKVVIEADGAIGASVEYNVLLDYSSGRAPAGITLQDTLAGGGSYWNNVNWNAFVWAAEDVAQIEGNIDGVGRNISLQIASSSTYIAPHTLYGITYHYMNRKLVR